jgi:hypothetical protein
VRSSDRTLSADREGAANAASERGLAFQECSADYVTLLSGHNNLVLKFLAIPEVKDRINHRDCKKRTGLHHAAMQGHVEVRPRERRPYGLGRHATRG